jgi:hypothetical protein
MEEKVIGTGKPEEYLINLKNMKSQIHQNEWGNAKEIFWENIKGVSKHISSEKLNNKSSQKLKTLPKGKTDFSIWKIPWSKLHFLRHNIFGFLINLSFLELWSGFLKMNCRLLKISL